jgi:hypothetical protein
MQNTIKIMETPKNVIRSKSLFLEMGMIVFFGSALLSGFLAPYNLMFYSRDFLDEIGIIDYIIIAVSILIALFLIAILQRYAKITFLVSTSIMILVNIVIPNVLSINSNNISTSGTTTITLFGDMLIIGKITIPLIIFIISGLFMVSSNMEILSYSDFYNKKSSIDRIKFIGLGVAFAFAMNGIIRAIDLTTVYSIFIIVPTGAILSVYTYFYIQYKFSILTFTPITNQTSKNIIGIHKPRRGIILTKGLYFYSLH